VNGVREASWTDLAGLAGISLTPEQAIARGERFSDRYTGALPPQKVKHSVDADAGTIVPPAGRVR
jgi:hypothetical protein